MGGALCPVGRANRSTPAHFPAGSSDVEVGPDTIESVMEGRPRASTGLLDPCRAQSRYPRSRGGSGCPARSGPGWKAGREPPRGRFRIHAGHLAPRALEIG